MLLSQQCCYYCRLRQEQSLNLTYCLGIIITMNGSSILDGGGDSSSSNQLCAIIELYTWNISGIKCCSCSVVTLYGNYKIADSVARQKGIHITTKLGNKDFRACDGWISNFKQPHDAVLKKESPKMWLMDMEECRKECVLMLTEDYQSNKIYFADETGLSFRLAHMQAWVWKELLCISGKNSTERIMDLVASNINDTNTIPPLVTG